jgi:Domain of unknown function (DUF222)
MAALLDLAPLPLRAASGVGEVHAAIDRLDVTGAVPVEQYAGLVGELERAIRRLEGAKLALLASADRARVADLSGMSDTAAWLSRQTRSGSAESARAVRLATELSPSSPAEPSRPTAQALSAGAVSPDHAAVIVQATSALPKGLDPESVETIERHLVERAERLDPRQLRREARRALATVEADRAVVDAHEGEVVRDEERQALAKTRLTIHENRDGTLSGHFTVPAVPGAILTRVIHSMTAPRRARMGAATAQAGDGASRRDWAHQAGLAFVELLEHLPTDRLHTKTAATVVITLDHDKLASAVGAAGLDTGDVISAGDLRRLACGAGLLPAVLNGASLPLDLGRTSRLFTEHQRVALAGHHTTCAADGCERPFAWCELHHRDPWSSGGRTDLAKAMPLCGFHHRRIHDRDYHHRCGTGGVTFHRRT